MSKSFIGKFWSTYKNMSLTIRASLLFTFCGLIQKGISVIAVPIYTRIMSAEDYGQYSVYYSWDGIITIFATLNMWNYLINNGMIEFKDRKEDFIASLQGLAAVITISWFLVYLPFSNSWCQMTGLTQTLMLVMFAELFTKPSFEYWSAVKRYNYDAKSTVIATIIISVVTPIVVIPVVLLSEQKGVAAILSKNIVTIAVYLVIAIGMIKKSTHFFDIEFWKYALKFNLPLVPHFLSMMVLQSSDRIMIERISSSADAGIYSVAYQAASALSIFNTAVLNTFVPYTYKAIEAGEEQKVGKRSLPLIIFIGVINFMAALSAPEIVRVLAPEKYYTAIYVIPPVAMSNLLMFLFNLFANIEYYYKETKLVAIASMISAIANIILNYIFINKYGFIAAGYTTVVCYVIFSFCHYIFMRRVSKKYMNGKKIYDAKMLLLIVGGFVFASVAITWLYDYKFMFARYILLVTLIITAWIKRKDIKGMITK